MTVAYKFIHETFASRVTLDRPNLQILVEYLEGPFSRLENRWTFRPTGMQACEVEFFIAYEFRSRTLGYAHGSHVRRGLPPLCHGVRATGGSGLCAEDCLERWGSLLLRDLAQHRECLLDRGMADLHPADIAVSALPMDQLAAARSRREMDKADGLAGGRTLWSRNSGD